ncbi:hypothetical protein [Salisediminibacterium beveridgei]|uniref:Cytochrome C and Quinol oxidase polypeptide I n=1 Tax=Salisediminibacterium beveridgei TaxID=632773 RepID=A0A1D7QXR8_9BACI|nr:hypothetical protein [Salisediminibacterium beveridgei]AOM83805.1 hypothetical protein BBEV_2465 [Salisediminibacterium beveridgei]
MRSYAKALLITAAIFGLVGVFIGSHMAGAGSYELRTFHAHMLVSGFLTTLAWGIFYLACNPNMPKLTAVHVWTAIIGSVSLNLGMLLYQVNPLGLPETFTLIFYIVGGSVYLISFVAFLIITLKLKTTET